MFGFGPSLAETSDPATERKESVGSESAWFPFSPARVPPTTEAATDLRFLNEKFAGELGFIGVKDGKFVHTKTGEAVRFWAVNGPPHELAGEDLRRCARLLAKYGVNLVRVHGGLFNKDGELDPGKVRHNLEIVEAMKAEGIYTHFSIYFPLWFTPRSDHPWLVGYDGSKHPFAALFFNQEFQKRYREWWRALLTTPSERTGKTLLAEPAVFGLEMQNEDSFFFWTFSESNIPDPQLRILEKMFGDWLVKKHGSLEAALKKWNGATVKRDAPPEGRMGFRPLWNIFSEKTPRDQDTAQFLLEVQTRFYAETYQFLRQLGFKGVIHASNWSTASPEVFGPLEKLSYTAGDCIDRHGYFECNHKGDNAAWSIRNGHTYSERSALRFDSSEPGKPKQFVHPVMDPHYDDKPSMISETTFTRPNRFRSEAPLYYAAYGALQDTDCIVHFAFDGADWKVKPNYWMQQWTLGSPAMLGQFPATALLYRRGLIKTGDVLADVRLNKADLMRLAGTPLPQDASLDELRLRDVPQGGELRPGQRIDPLIHYAGRTQVRFVEESGGTTLSNLKPFIDHAAQTVTSSTRELKLDYGKGLLVVNADKAQGASGQLKGAGSIETKDLTITSTLELGHILAVSLDDQPLATSGKILVQVMSEESTSNFQVDSPTNQVKRIVEIGTDPWRVKDIEGRISLKRADAAELKVTPLDFDGYAQGEAGSARDIRLRPTTLYYLIAR